MDRRWHRMAALSGQGSPQVCVFVDTESEDVLLPTPLGARELAFRLGVAHCVWLSEGKIVDEAKLGFSSPERFWGQLQQWAPRRGQAWVFAHNLGFDLTLLGFWRWLDRQPDSLVYAVLEDPPSLVLCKMGRKMIHFVDTLNFWRCSVAKLGQSLGCPKLPMPAVSSSHTDWYDYCNRDVEIIKRCVCSLIRFVQETLSCSFRPTAASLSWSAWRSSNGYRPPLIHGNYRALSLERQALFGGRLESFASGTVQDHVTDLDCNSLYPAMMVQHPMPVQLVSMVRNPRLSDVTAWLRQYGLVADVELGTEHPAYPQRTTAGVVRSTGPGLYTLCGPELRSAVDCGSITMVHRAALYLERPLGVSFLRDIYGRKTKARLAGDRATECACKLILNGFCGKFAQLHYEWRTDERLVARDRWGFWWGTDPDTRRIVRCRVFAGVRQKALERSEPQHSMPVVFAWICSLGRHQLEQFFRLAGPAEVLYTDTDSLHVRPRGRARLCDAGMVSDSSLGKLRVVREGTPARYWGLKAYQIGDHRVVGCIRGNAVEVADGIWQQENFAGIQQTIQTGRLDTIEVRPRTIHLSERSRQAERNL